MKMKDIFNKDINELKPIILSIFNGMSVKEQKKYVKWGIDEYGYGRSFFLTRENCLNTYNSIIKKNIDKNTNDFYKALINHMNKYAFGKSALMTFLELDKEINNK